MSRALADFESAAADYSADVAGETVTIRNADASWSVSVVAERGKTGHDRSDRQGVKIRSYSVDWIVKAALLVNSSDAIQEPVRNWEVVTANGDVYRVLPFGGDDDCWRWSGNTETHRRLFTKAKPD